MIVDLHSHYPMHLLAGDPATLDVMLTSGTRSFPDRIRALALRIANRVANYPGSGGEPAVTPERLGRSNVRVALSVLYRPFDEMDVAERYGAPPRATYFANLLHQIEMVEKSVVGHEADIAVAHNHTELEAALAGNTVALVHVVEGGFHLGDTEPTIRANVRILAERGVASITVAHLFWRKVATNAPAVPFLPDWLYTLLFPQPATGLDVLGRILVRAMVEHRILVDVTHMSAQAIDDTLALLDEIDAPRAVPLIAGHSACKMDGPQYNVSDAHIKAIAERRGVVGLIACEHWMGKGLKKPKTFSDTVDIVCRHIDRIHQAAGSDEVAAIGSDQDGFIKPTLPGLETPEGYTQLETALVDRYGAETAERICSGNALRVLGYWGGGT